MEILKQMHKLSILLLFLYVTFSSFSGYAYLLIQNIGKYGKIAILLLTFYLLFFIAYSRGLTFIKVLKDNSTFLYLFSSFLFGSFYGYLNSNNVIYVYYTIYIILSIMFIMLIYYNLRYKIRILDFFKIFELIIVFQFLLGFLLILVLNIDIYDRSVGGLSINTGGLSGFLEKRNTFGLLATVGFFVSFYVYRNTRAKKSLFLILAFLILIYFTKARFVYIIILSFFGFLLYLKMKDKISNANLKFLVNYVQFILIFLIILFISILFANYQNLVYEFTTGRLLVWNLFVKEFFNDFFGSIIGYGSSYLSDLILEKYSSSNYYIRILDSLSLHSSYFKLLEIGGGISLLLFLYLNYKAIKNANNYFKAVMISFLLGGFVESYLMNPNTIAAMFYWLIVIMSLAHKKESNFNEQN